MLIIAISLSMDAFSLALAYGTLDNNKKEIFTLSLIVGIYHFFMPLLGFFLGNKILSIFTINNNYLVSIILVFIGLEMIIDTLRNSDKMCKMKFIQMLVFGFSVSIDSFSLGIGLNSLTNNVFIASLTFSLISFLFTLCGLYIGKKINQILGRVSTLIGGCILILIAFLYIL